MTASERTGPRFSIVTPVFNPPEDAFVECIESVLTQTSSDWEWCIADDCSTSEHVGRHLRELAAHGAVRIHRRTSTGGIVTASNDAAALATGEFIVLLDHDDLLAPEALELIAARLDEYDDVDYLYTDEDKIAADSGRFFDRFEKPDWSPERLRGQNYCSHLSVIRRTLFESAGRFREGFDGSQDYDLILRVTEQARRIEHVDEVLYHWRAVEGSAATLPDAKPYAFDAARRALDEHFARVGVHGTSEQSPITHFYRTRHTLVSTPLVSIVIPTRGSRKVVWGIDTCLVTNAVRSIAEKSSYDGIEVVVVVDRGTPRSAIDDLRQILGDRLTLVPYDKPFNFADKVNRGVVASSGDVVILLNDDTQVISEDWIETLLGHLQEPDVGMVGPMLLFADGRIQSAGHYNNPTVMHLASGVHGDATGPIGILTIASERTGVTAACAALRRATYDEVGGLSLEFPNSFNDVDLAFKLLLRGLRVIWTPFARLYHFESLSRDPAVSTEEVLRLYARWQSTMENEPFVRGFDAWWTGLDDPSPTRRARLVADASVAPIVPLLVPEGGRER